MSASIGSISAAEAGVDDTLAQLGLPYSALTGKPVLHFAHANGIPSQVYEPLFAALTDHFSIEYVEQLGVGPYRVTDHWHNLTQQVIDSVTHACQKHQVTQVVGFGHSLGALCTLRAVYQSPQLFAQAVLLDPPLIMGKDSFVWHMAKQLDRLPWMQHRLIDKLSPSGLSKHRRDVWDSREQAAKQLQEKSLFKTFDQRCFEAYIQHGLMPRKDGKVTLRITKDTEVAVFRTNPSRYWLPPYRRPVKPVMLVVGEDSLFLQRRFPQRTKARLGINFETHPGGHMFPLERPDSVAERVLALVRYQAQQNRTA